MPRPTSVARRRRLALVLSAVLALAAAVAVFLTGDRSYEATASVLLLPPASTVEENGNPLLQLGGLQQVVDVVAAEVGSTISEPDFTDERPGAEIEVAPDGRTSAPALAVIVQDADPEVALEIRDEVAALAVSQLEQIQTAIAIQPERQVTAIILTESTTAAEQLTGRVRSAIVAGAGVGIALLLIAGLIESILVRRESRPPADPAASGAEPDGPVSDGPASSRSQADRVTSDGPKEDRSASDGPAADGSEADDSSARGSTSHGPAAGGSDADNPSARGSTSDGPSARGSTSDGPSARGSTSHGPADSGSEADDSSVSAEPVERGTGPAADRADTGAPSAGSDAAEHDTDPDLAPANGPR